MKRTDHYPIALWTYLAFAAVATLQSGRLFYGAMLEQTHGEWSAPLDDVFIHFDYARATARGYPFQWSEGNGFSTGNTSLLYPIVLALGYWVGARDTRLMIWAATIAAVSVFGFLWVARSLFKNLPTWTTWLAPCALFSVGALSWSFWSGMEVAFFLGIWSIAAAIAFALTEERLSVRLGGWLLGIANTLIVLTRPEGAAPVAILSIYTALALTRERTVRDGITTLLRVAVLPVSALIAQAFINLHFTGETTANGAIVKLAVLNPYMNATEKLDDYIFNLKYAFDRIHLHHFGAPPDAKPLTINWGHTLLFLGIVPLFDRRTAARAWVLALSAVSWTLMVGLNGQVRWQNERYLMPAVAWELILAGLGLAVILSPSKRPRLANYPWGHTFRSRFVFLDAHWRWLLGGWPSRLPMLLLALHWGRHWWELNRIQYRDQVWFFARACRNIRDQHLTAGRLLQKLEPTPHRVLVGDAGAIMYSSDLPGFDLIGLGGYKRLPIARASVQGLAASLELIEHIPKRDRPDVMAIYPTWWVHLPNWFGKQILAVPVEGNVICGGAEKVIYEANWSLLDTGAKPRSVPKNTRIFDEIDFADLLSEGQHNYVFPRPHAGYADMRVLPDPADTTKDIWDAGRHIPPGRTETMVLHNLPANTAVKLVFRTTADRPVSLKIRVGSFETQLAHPAKPGWIEPSVEIPASHVTSDLPLTLTPVGEEWLGYHLWVVPSDFP